MKVVLDTNVLLSATIWEDSASEKLLSKLIRLGIPLFSSVEIISEYQKILKRDFYYSDEEIADMTSEVMLFSKIVRPKIKVTVIKEDPDDDKIIECALAAEATHILTYDKDLLRLKKFKEIIIVRPEELTGSEH